MQNPKYYEDIKKFPNALIEGFDMAKDIKIEGEFNRVVLCGMGGSSSFVSILNNYFSDFTPFRMEVVKGYDIPNYSDAKTLFIIASYSGNTEETFSCLTQVVKEGYKFCILTSGGKLLDFAKTNNTPLMSLPTGIQPRLTTGYFISQILKLLQNSNLIPNIEAEVKQAASKISASLDEEKSKTLAKVIKGKLPIVYGTENNDGIALTSKIKFNESSKTQAFWNIFSELNHNEMVGFTNLVTTPYFLILKSKFCNPRQPVRMEVFLKLMQEKGVEGEIIELKGDSNLEEMFNTYYFMDHVAMYLAEEYMVDPEPVAMVEQFKKMI